MFFARTLQRGGYAWLLLCLVLTQLCFVLTQVSLGQSPKPARIFLIGNSLTWDTLPGLLEGEVQWHVDCGKNLKYIYEHPEAPCVKTSTLWPAALQARQYDVLCVQPHFGTSLKEDVAVISAWLKLQPAAKLVLHTGWNRAADFEAGYHAATDGQHMLHSPQYFQRLTAELLKLHPKCDIRCTGAMDVLDDIYHDIEHARAPFQSFDQLFRDNIHVTIDVGRYLMHNLMRIALEQPLSDQGFQIDPPQKQYLIQKLKAVQARHAAKP